MKKTEAVFSRKLQNAIRKQGWFVVKYHANQYTPAGIPDLLICADGLFVGIELKADSTKKPSPIQIEQGERIKKAGGLWMCVDSETMSVTEIVSLIEEQCAHASKHHKSHVGDRNDSVLPDI